MRPNPYESRRYLQEYLLFHYGRPRDICRFASVPRAFLRFHERLRKDYLLPVRARGRTRALDLGCAVGRFTFELGRVVNHAVGIDNSASFIRAARRMARYGSLTASVKDSGARLAQHSLMLPALLRDCHVEFRVADAMELTSLFGDPFQVVSAINLIDRLPCPRKFLHHFRGLVAPHGQLIIAAPFTWLEEYTPPGEWLTSQQVRSILRPDFRLAKRGDLPFVIAEHRRKYQLVVAEVMTLVRR